MMTMMSVRFERAFMVLLRDLHISELAQFESQLFCPAVRKIWEERNIERSLRLWRHYGEKLKRAFMKRCIYAYRQRVRLMNHQGEVFTEANWSIAQKQLESREMSYEISDTSEWYTGLTIPRNMFGGVINSPGMACSECATAGFGPTAQRLTRISDIVWVTAFMDGTVTDYTVRIELRANGLSISQWECQYAPVIQFPLFDGHYGLPLDSRVNFYTEFSIKSNARINHVIFTGNKRTRCHLCPTELPLVTSQFIPVHKASKCLYIQDDQYAYVRSLHLNYNILRIEGGCVIWLYSI